MSGEQKLEQQQVETTRDSGDTKVARETANRTDLVDKQKAHTDHLKAGGRSGVTDDFGKPVFFDSNDEDEGGSSGDLALAASASSLLDGQLKGPASDGLSDRAEAITKDLQEKFLKFDVANEIQKLGLAHPPAPELDQIKAAEFARAKALGGALGEPVESKFDENLRAHVTEFADGTQIRQFSPTQRSIVMPDGTEVMDAVTNTPEGPVESFLVVNPETNQTTSFTKFPNGGAEFVIPDEKGGLEIRTLDGKTKEVKTEFANGDVFIENKDGSGSFKKSSGESFVFLKDGTFTISDKSGKVIRTGEKMDMNRQHAEFREELDFFRNGALE